MATLKSYSGWNRESQEVLERIAASGDKVLKQKYESMTASAATLVNTLKTNVNQTHKDNLVLRGKLQECNRRRLQDQQEKAELQDRVGKKDVIIADLRTEVLGLKRQVKKYQDVEKYPNGYPCKYAYRGCTRLADNRPNKKTHEKYCNFRKVDQNGQPMPLSAAQKKKQQKKKRALQKKAGGGSYERSAASGRSDNVIRGPSPVLEEIEMNDIYSRK